jgi:predicted transcriptional regulator
MSESTEVRKIVEDHRKQTKLHSKLFRNLYIVECGNQDGNYWIDSEFEVKPEVIDAFGNFNAGLFNALFDILSYLLANHIGKSIISLNISVNCLENVGIKEIVKSRTICTYSHENYLIFKIEAFVGNRLVGVGSHSVKYLENLLSPKEKL